VGPLVAASLGVRGVDVGNPMLSMHSAREMCGTADQARMAAAMTRFFAGG
jgi:aspartyl aminopeptidase